jgi:hypothetical protein
VIPATTVHSSAAVFTQAGIGTVIRAESVVTVWPCSSAAFPWPGAPIATIATMKADALRRVDEVDEPPRRALR